MKKKLLIVIFMVFALASSYSQLQTPQRVLDFIKEYTPFYFNQNFEKQIELLTKFESNPDLTLLEKQTIIYFKGTYFLGVAKETEALRSWERAIVLSENSTLSKQIKMLATHKLATLYFTKQNFKKAFEYALKVKTIDKEKYYYEYINVHSIIGFYYYLNKNYQKSLVEYNLANDLITKKKDFCKAPEVLMKIAKTYDKLGNFDKAVQIIERCIKTSDSCGVEVNSVNSKKAKYEILKNNKKLLEALKLNEEIIKQEKLSRIDERNKKIDELETKYNIKLKNQQNKSLTALNAKKDEVVKKQQSALIGALIAVLIFIILLFLLIRLSRKQKKTNAELSTQKEIIESNNKELNRLNVLNQKIFSVISHDFKGPIFTLKTLLNTKEVQEIENKRISSYLQSINLQLDQADAMLKSLLDWAKIEMNLNASNAMNFNLMEATTAVCDQLEQKRLAKNIVIENKIDMQETINFPQEIFIIVFRNLVSNGIKYSFVGGKIGVTFDNNVLRISDNGKGIDEKKLSKLFQQGVNPGIGTQNESGFGIGLYLSNELMQKHKGSLKAYNNGDGGCTFAINFPI